MRKIILAALATTALVGPAMAGGWYGIGSSTHQCSLVDGTSPVDMYRLLQFEGYAPAIVENPPGSGRVLVKTSQDAPDGFVFYRSLDACEKDRQKTAADLQKQADDLKKYESPDSPTESASSVWLMWVSLGLLFPGLLFLGLWLRHRASWAARAAVQAAVESSRRASFNSALDRYAEAKRLRPWADEVDISKWGTK